MGFFWCCCDCICRIIGDIYGAESGQPPCEGKIDVVPIPCDTGLDSSRVRWQVVRTSDTPETVVFEGDYTDFLASSGEDGYLRFYMTEDGAYELRIWYEPEGYAPPCEGLPTAANPFVRVITNEVECCPNSCPIDPTAITSNVTLSGYLSQVEYNVPYELVAGGGTISGKLDPVGYYEKSQFLGWDIFNGTFSTNEIKTGIVEGDYECLVSVAELKVFYLGEIEHRFQEFYNPPFIPPGPTTQAHAKGKVWLAFGSVDYVDGEPVPGTPDWYSIGTRFCQLIVKTTEYQEGVGYNLDNSPRVVPPRYWVGSSTIGAFSVHQTRPDELLTSLTEQLTRPCFVNYGPTYDYAVVGYPANAPINFDGPEYHPDWYNYHTGVGVTFAGGMPVGYIPPWPCQSVWVVN